MRGKALRTRSQSGHSSVAYARNLVEFYPTARKRRLRGKMMVFKSAGFVALENAIVEDSNVTTGITMDGPPCCVRAVPSS